MKSVLKFLSFTALMGIVLTSLMAVSAQPKSWVAMADNHMSSWKWPDTTKPAPPHHAPKAINDSTPILSARDLQELVNLLQDYPARYTNPITNWLQTRYLARKTELGY